MTRLSSRQIMFYVIYPRIWKIYLVFWKFGNYDAGRGIFAEEFPVYGFDHIIFHNFQPLRRICAEEPFVLVQSPINHVRGKDDFIADNYCKERSEWDLIMCILYDEHIIGSSGTRLYLCKHMIYKA